MKMETRLTNINKDSKTKLFTHIDLDGVGCAIVGKLAFEDIDITYVKNPNDASKKVVEFIDENGFDNFDHVFITDISVSNDAAKELDLFRDRVTLLDHHATAEYLNQYQWASVETNHSRGHKNSGTNMFFELLDSLGFFDYSLYRDALYVFVEKVRRYDTWEWKEVYSDKVPSYLNDLFWLYGIDKFLHTYYRRFKDARRFKFIEGEFTDIFDPADIRVLEIDSDKKLNYIEYKNKQLSTFNILGNKVGVVFAEQYISELGNTLSEMNPELKFIAIIDAGQNKVSLRTVSEEIDLGKDVASVYGGGGHPKASGFEFNKGLSNLFIKTVFKIGALSKIINVIVDKKGKQ